MLSKILCATDGSAAAVRAADLAIRLARRSCAPLSFLTVLAPVERAAASDTADYWGVAVLEWAEADGKSALGMAARMCLEVGFHDFRLVTVQGGEPARAIVGYADGNQYDHIVTGSAGLTGVRRLLAGSTASEIIQLAHCPVTVVR